MTRRILVCLCIIGAGLLLGYLAFLLSLWMMGRL